MPQFLIPSIILIVTIFATLSACEDPNGQQSDGPETNLSTAPQAPLGIVGGETTGGATKWRGVVALRSSNGLCSGTLIHPRVVLTAGHCVKLHNFQGNYDYTTKPSGIQIWAGANAYTGTFLARAGQIALHPTWTGQDAENEVDLALVYLSKNISTINIFKIRDFPLPEFEQEALLVGYGIGPNGKSGVQRMGPTTIQTVTNRFITTAGKSNACPGDSGGPVLINNGGTWEIAGVNSFGAGQTCDPQFEMYTVNILGACHWLNTKMKDFVGADLGLTHCTQCQIARPSSWGQACGPSQSSCPAGTVCFKPNGFSQNGSGYCAAPCCSLGSKDSGSCFNVAGGDEKCSFVTDTGLKYCAIHCADASDCPGGMICRNRPFKSEKICIADGSAIPVDTGGDGDTDGDGDGDTDGDGDRDTDGDTEENRDTETSERSRTGTSGCQITKGISSKFYRQEQTASRIIVLLRKLF